MNIFKLKIWVEGCEINKIDAQWRDFYFDVKKISGWFVANKTVTEKEDDSINILFEGDMITVKKEPHLLFYLKNEWVDMSSKAYKQ